MNQWIQFLPEMVLAASLGLVLMGNLSFPGWRRILTSLAVFGTLLTLALVIFLPEGAWGGVFINDLLAKYLKALMLVSQLLVLGMAWDFEKIWGRPQCEFLVLLLSSVLGMMFIASGNELILLYVGLELTTFPLILLTAYAASDKRSAEGGLKYLIIASLASALFLFGLSLVYATTGVTRLTLLANAIATRGFGPLLIVGVLCLIAGIGFKLALVPFHMWAPDAYEGATTPITAFLSVASKTAGFALALRLLASALPAVQAEWRMILAVLSAASMLWGNFAAIPQTNLKRLLAYSSIAQAGYMTMGLVAFQGPGISSLLFYLSAYLFTNLAVFAVVIAVERTTGSTDLTAFTGLAQRAPRLALFMLLALLSLAGIPPLAGFAGKFYLFAAAYGQGYGWLVVLGVLNSALSLYYYLRIIRVIYILPPTEQTPQTFPLPAALVVVLFISVLGILCLGIYPRPLVDLARLAMVAWF